MLWYLRWLDYINAKKGSADPGQLNQTNDIDDFIDLKRMHATVQWQRSIVGDIHLLPSAKEDKDYKVIPHTAWVSLLNRYGAGSLHPREKIPPPSCLPRLSIPVPTADETKQDHIVELN